MSRVGITKEEVRQAIAQLRPSPKQILESKILEFVQVHMDFHSFNF